MNESTKGQSSFVRSVVCSHLCHPTHADTQHLNSFGLSIVHSNEPMVGWDTTALPIFTVLSICRGCKNVGDVESGQYLIWWPNNILSRHGKSGKSRQQ